MNVGVEEITCNFSKKIRSLITERRTLRMDVADELIEKIKEWKNGDTQFKEIDEALTKLKVVDSEWHVLENFKEDGDW